MITSARAHMSVMLTLMTCVPIVASASAAPVLRSADIHITITSPTTCEVTMALNVEGASNIEHRVDAPPSPNGGFGAHVVDLVHVQGAEQVGEIRTIGRTRSLVLRPAQPSYAFRYRAEQSEDRAYRCPMWLPTVATDGTSRTVRLGVDLPSSVVPAGSMPAFTWTGTHGSATLGHVPAFVRVPYASPGEARALDIAQVMDAAAIVVFAGASALWVWRRRR